MCKFLIDSILCIKYIIIHKYYVLKFGLKLKAPIWSLIIHDWNKFLPSEFAWHVNKNNERIGRKFYKQLNKSYFLHIRRSKHHWNYWIFIKENLEIEAIEIPERYIREIIADWLSAGYSKHHKIDIINWYADNKNKILFHPKTKKRIEEILKTLDFKNENVNIII